jgi:hypothetical protein
MTPLEVAKYLARRHGLRIAVVEKGERRDPAVPGDYVDVYVVYRNGVRMGKRRDPARLLSFVKSLISRFEQAAHAAR